MEKNTAWAIGLSSVVLIGFFFLQTALMPKQQPAPVEAPVAAVANDETAEISVNKTEEKNVLISDSTETAVEENFVIETEKVKVTFTNRGGDVISYELKEHNDSDTGSFIQMADNISDKNRAFALSLGDSKSSVINDIFTARKIDEKTIGFFKKYSIKNEDGSIGYFTLVKTYKFGDDYTFKLDVTVDGGENFNGLNFAGNAYTLRTSPQIGPFFNPKMNRYENRQFISYNGDKKKKIILGTNQVKSYDKSFKWIAMAGKYFEIITMPVNAETMDSNVNYSTKSELADKSDAQAYLTRLASDSKKFTDSYYIYVGPRNEKELRIYNESDKNSWGLEGSRFDESMQTSGMLSWLEVILKLLLEIINKAVKNWGVSIIILTAILKFAMFPITAKTAKSTVKMQEVQPKMQAIQEKYKDNPQKLNEQTMKLYKEIGYNPMSGCLPMLFQFVILFAMYNLFNNYFEFRGASFIPGWIEDLSAGDHVKTLGFNLPFLGNQLRLLPVIYVISQLFYGKITQNGGTSAGNAGQMKMMMYGMPILFFFLFYNAPSGLLLYWTVSNLIQLGQQLYINKTIKK